MCKRLAEHVFFAEYVYVLMIDANLGRVVSSYMNLVLRARCSIVLRPWSLERPKEVPNLETQGAVEQSSCPVRLCQNLIHLEVCLMSHLATASLSHLTQSLPGVRTHWLPPHARRTGLCFVFRLGCGKSQAFVAESLLDQGCLP